MKNLKRAISCALSVAIIVSVLPYAVALADGSVENSWDFEDAAYHFDDESGTYVWDFTDISENAADGAKTVEYNGLSIHLQQGDYINSADGVHFSGNGAAETRCVEFTPEYDGTLTVNYYMNNNPSKYMRSYIYNADTNTVVSETVVAGRVNAVLTAEVEAGTTYYMYSVGNSSNNYAQQITRVLYTAPELADSEYMPERTYYYSMGDETESDSGISYEGEHSFVTGQKGVSLELNGGYAKINEFPLGERFTFSAWVKPSDLSMWERLFDFGTDTSRYIFLTVNSGDNYPRLAAKNGGDEESITSSQPLNAGTWSYITVTMDYGSTKMYINGELTASGNIKIPVSDLEGSLNNYIGKSQYNDPLYKGCIDEVEIFNYAMTEDEIIENMAATASSVKTVESVEDQTIFIGEKPSLPSELTVTYENEMSEKIPVKWNIPVSFDEEGDFEITGTLLVSGKEISVTAKVSVRNASSDENYTIKRSINFVKNTGISYADVLYSIKTDLDDELTMKAEVYKDGNMVGEAVTKTISDADELNGDNVFLRVPLDETGELVIKSSLFRSADPQSVISEVERTVENTASFADSSDIQLEKDSRMEVSERVGLGYIMGIDLPRLVAPSYEVHGLTLRYGENDDAVLSGDKKAGDVVKRYGGWEALGGWKVNASPQYTLAGQQMGHWLSAAAVYYNHMKNESDIELTASSLNGSDTSDTAPKPKGDTVISPKDIHNKMEYVIAKLDELQNTDLPSGWTSVKNKEYIGGCDETPFLNCFEGKSNWCGVYWVPWYNIHKVYQGLLDVYDYAEPELAEKAYTVLKRLADWAVTGTSGLTDAQMQSVLNTEYGGINEIFARMYEITGDEIYKETARRFTHDSVIDPLISNDTKSLDGKHANTQIPKFIGAAELYEQDSETYSDYRTACENFWKNVNYERCYAIGGNSLNEHFQKQGTEELGVKTCESCNTYNMMRLTEHLFSWDQKAEYMDWYERALYNHVLGQQDPETGAKMYFVSMVQGTHRIYEQKYNSWWCCTGTGMENPGRYTRTEYFENGDDLYVNLYLPGTYTWEDKGLTLTVDTEYPYSESVRITVSGNGNTGNIKLRAPGWISREMTVSVNGEQKASSDGGEYVTLSGIGDGDVIEFSIPMDVSIYESRDNQKIAYEYGPMVLAAKLDGTIRPNYEYIWGERNTACQQVAYPILKSTDGKGKNTSDDLCSYIEKVGGDGTLEFVLPADRNSTGKDVTLVPFVDITHSYHNVYFDIDTSIDEYAINLSNVQIDYVDPDGQQSELGHGMAQSSEDTTEYRSKSVQGNDENGQYRFAYGEGGFFKYDMLVDKSSDKNYLILRYYDNDSTVTVNTDPEDETASSEYGVKFRIYADGTALTIDGKDYMEVSGGSGGFINKLIEIPNEVVEASTRTDASTGYNIVSIKFEPYDATSATVPYRKLYTTTGDPENMSSPEKELPQIISVSSDGSKVSYTSGYNSSEHKFDMYAALYNKDGVLESVKMNEANGEFTIDPGSEYIVKFFFWDGMESVYDPVEKNI